MSSASVRTMNSDGKSKKQMRIRQRKQRKYKNGRQVILRKYNPKFLNYLYLGIIFIIDAADLPYFIQSYRWPRCVQCNGLPLDGCTSL